MASETQLVLFETNTGKNTKVRTIQNIQAQINVLEIKLTRSVAEGKSPQQIFALNGKLKKLRVELSEAKNFEWLAK